MASLITADDFFLVAVAILKRNDVDILPVDEILDKKFAKLYSLAFDKLDQKYTPSFNFLVDEIHQSSRRFRETMYAARFNNIVSLENPTFHRMKIKLSSDDAAYFINNSEIANVIEDCVISVFKDNIANAKSSD